MPKQQPTKVDPRQLPLDFHTAPAERRVLWYSALKRCRGADLRHKCLLELADAVFAKGDGWLRRTVAELAEELWCSPASARRTIKRLVEWGLLEMEEHRYVTRGQRENAYRLNLAGARNILGLPQPGGSQPVPQPGCQIESPPSQSARGPFQIDRPPSQFESPFKETTPFQPTILEDHPPPPTLDQASNRGPTSPEWRVVVVELEQAGVVEASSAVAAARERGVSPGQVRDLVAFYAQDPSRWESAGVLQYRVRTATPEKAASAGWPPPSEAWQRRRDAAAKDESRRRRRDEAQREAAEREGKAAEAAAIEASHGSCIDAADDAGLKALVAEHLPAFLAGKWREARSPGLVREQLLLRLADQSQSQPEA